MEGRESHLKKPDGSSYTQQDLLAFKEQQGEARAKVIIQGAVDTLLKESTLIFYLDQVFDTGLETELRSNQAFPVIQYSPNFYSEHNNIDGQNLANMDNARELARELIVESVHNLEISIAEKKVKTGLKLEMSDRGVGVDKIGKILKESGFTVEITNEGITCRKIIKLEGDEKNREQKKKWFPKLLGFGK